MNRYRLSFAPDRSAVTIYDREMQAYCGLPETQGGDVRPLLWEFAGDVHSDSADVAWTAAEDWLERCYKTWKVIPRTDEPHPAVVGWQIVTAIRAGRVADRHFRPYGPDTVSHLVSRTTQSWDGHTN